MSCFEDLEGCSLYGGKREAVEKADLCNAGGTRSELCLTRNLSGTRSEVRKHGGEGHSRDRGASFKRNGSGPGSGEKGEDTSVNTRKDRQKECELQLFIIGSVSAERHLADRIGRCRMRLRLKSRLLFDNANRLVAIRQRETQEATPETATGRAAQRARCRRRTVGSRASPRHGGKELVMRDVVRRR